MYTSSTQPGSPGGYASHDYRSGYAGNISRSYSYGRPPPIDPPRPLEPRPTLHSSLSESAGSSRHHNVSHGPLSPEHRPHGQNLPALRDILPPGPRPTSHSSYNVPWNRESDASSNRPRADSHYLRPGLHPPMVLHPSSDFGQKYHPPQTVPFEVPILQTSPVTNQTSQPVGMPPYPGYVEPRREHQEFRAEKAVVDHRGPYLRNDMSRQFNSATPDEGHYRSQFATHDPAASTPYTPTASDNRGSYLGVQEVPGEGTYYVYESGQRIPTHVDGEQVNPAWGLTKANKPRKRLALACLDCREKKIKCEPGVSSCLQCEKAKRICRRAQTHPSQQDASTVSWPSAGGSPVRGKPSISDPTPTRNRDTEPDPFNKRRTREDPSPPNVPTKKHRSASPVYTSQDAVSAPRDGMQGIDRASPKEGASLAQRHQQSDAHYDWDIDPYDVDPGLTTHLINLYFAHINNASYCMFPRGYFLNWLHNYRDKCQNERMVIYAMLAMATIFADNNLHGLGKQFASIAGDAVASQFGKFNITTAQTHIILSLYHFAKGANDVAVAHYGSAVYSVRIQRFNTEQACAEDNSTGGQPRVEFGFAPAQLAECKRRTFWSALFMDRSCGANTCEIKPEDVFLRLPCTDDMYERGVDSDAPYLSNGIIDPSKSIITAASPISPMAWLMIIAVLWGNVVDSSFRMWHRAPDGYGDAYNAFYDETTQLLQGWRSRLPPQLQYSAENLDRSIQQGYAGTFISMHTLYYFAQIKMNRYMRHKATPNVIPRNLEAAHESAHELLQMMGAVHSVRRAISSPAEGQPTSFTLSTPFPGYATLAAIDITSAGGWEWTLTATMQEIADGLGCLGELSAYWASAEDQLKSCQKRYYQIQNILQRRRSKEGAWMGKKWGLEIPLEQEFDDPEYDCVWGLGDSDAAQRVYFDTLKKDEDHTKAQPGGLRIA